MKKINNTKVISIDAATKSLAVACLNMQNIQEQNTRFIELTRAITNGEITESADLAAAFEEMNVLLTPIKINSLQVVDLIPERQVSKCGLIERSAALVAFLHGLTDRLTSENWLDTETHIVVEYQMGQNRKSGDIQTQIIYHFLQYLPASNIHIIGPSLKNKLHYPADPKSRHSHHIAEYDTLYTANKSHTKYLFTKWLATHKQMEHIYEIPKKNYADIADAFCQAAAWFILRQHRAD
jgi:hypothetical protein